LAKLVFCLNEKSDHCVGKDKAMKKICRNCHFLAKAYLGEGLRRTFLSSAGKRIPTAKESPAIVEDEYPLTCHMGVWSKECRTKENSEGVFTVSLNEGDRRDAAKGSLDFLQDRYILKCHMGVWDEAVHPAQKALNEAINKTARKDRCFFFPHQPGMQFQVAEEFQKSEHRYLDKLNIYMRIGFWLISIGLLLNAIFGILGFYE
jgi:hypothetical protein